MAAALVLVLAAGSGPQDRPAGTEQRLRTRVVELVRLLDASKAAVRQQAEDDLIAIGPAARRFLPPEDAEYLSAEQRRRLANVRAAYARQAVLAVLQPGRVTLQAKAIPLSKLVNEIQRQTGNRLEDLRAQFGQPVDDPELSISWKDKPFWQALDELAAKTGLGYYLYTGEPKVGLIARPVPPLPHCYAGPLRVAVKRLVRSLDYETGRKVCHVDLEIAWEPRLKPILFEYVPAETEAVDDQGRPVAPCSPVGGQASPERPIRLPADRTLVRSELPVHLAPPAADARRIASLHTKLWIIVPADVQRFQFDELTATEPQRRQQGKMSVTLERFRELAEGMWAADVVLQYPATTPAFESYQSWFYDNEVYLEHRDGSRFTENGGTTLTAAEPGRIAIQYRFVDAPGQIKDYRLIYMAPATIVREPVSCRFSNLELP